MFVKVTNGSVDQFPYTIGQLRHDNPNTSFPKNIPETTLNEYGVYLVLEADKPSYNAATQRIKRADTPTESDGKWTVGWTVSSIPNDELAVDNRAKRNTLLAATDWWAGSDLTMTDEQIAYRQTLRDITSHANWPMLNDSDWPTDPLA